MIWVDTLFSELWRSCCEDPSGCYPDGYDWLRWVVLWTSLYLHI